MSVSNPADNGLHDEKLSDSASRVFWLLAGVTLTALALIPLIRDHWLVFHVPHGLKSLVALLEVAFGLIVLTRYRLSGNPLHPVALVLLTIWLILTTASIFASESLAVALTRQAEWFAHGLFGYGIFTLARANPDFRIETFFLGGLVAYFAVFILYWHLLPDPAEHAWQNGTPGFTNIRHLGYYVSACLPLALAAYAYRAQASTPSNHAWQSTLCVLAMTNSWFFIFWAGGRGPLAALLAGLLIIILIGHQRRALASRASLLLIGTAIPGLALAAQYAVPGYGIGRILHTIQEAESLGDLSPGRMEIWRQTFEAIKANPYLGHGPDSFLFQTGELNRAFLHPHSFPLQAALDGGIPNTIICLVLGGGFLFWVLRRKPIPALNQAASRDLRDLGLTWMLVSLAAFSAIDGTLYHSHPSMLIAIAAGILAANRLGVSVAQKATVWSWPLAVVLVVVFFLHTVSLHHAFHPGTNSQWGSKVLIHYPSGMADNRAERHLRQRAIAWLESGDDRAVDLINAASKNTRPRSRTIYAETFELLQKGNEAEAILRLESGP